MIIKLVWEGKEWQANLNKPLSISIPINEDSNPNCYYADPVKFEVITAAGFVGSTQLGGSVNHKKITISPHGNGTHTECYGHITNSMATVNMQLKAYHIFTQLISITPDLVGNDLVITDKLLRNTGVLDGIKGLVVRSLPNSTDKLHRNYSGANPPYFDKKAIQFMVDCGIEHLVTDLPSVDREIDEGRLSAHKTFWQTEGNLRADATITELAYIDSRIDDGLYLLNLQILNLALDAAPSHPILFSLISA